MSPGKNPVTGVVFNIQRFTVHDGPGIRTEIFLKGCPLHCQWCSNPESIKTYPQIGVYASRCIGADVCGQCLSSCPLGNNIFSMREGKVCAINRDICTDCLKCADLCPANALMIWGKSYSADDIMDVVLSDIEFYDNSGGGVTLSGGDPLIQWEFTRAILQECKKHRIHTCLETELAIQPDIVARVSPHADMIITDIKHMDPQKHKAFTGVDNKLILKNIVSIARKGTPLIIRIPVIPGHNDTRENIAATAGFIKDSLDNQVMQVQLLPFRPLGVEKYESLGLNYGMDGFQAPPREVWEKNILSLVEIMKTYGIAVVAGSSHKT